SLEWDLLRDPFHHGIQRLVADLNHLYTELPALHRFDFEAQCFEWIDCNDAERSTASYMRRSESRIAVVVLNFTPVPRQGYRLGVPIPGTYLERLNSDSECYGGTNLGNGGRVATEPVPCNGMPCSLSIALPPLAALILVPEQ
ncbi:glycogen branching enzyme, partial [mine drainage metagenome]